MYNFRFRSNPLTRATASAAGMVLVAGLMLIGFAFLVFILKDLFALLAAMIFIMAGLGTISFAVKLFIASRRFSKTANSHANYRENVRIHHRTDRDDFMNF